ncbi:MAG: hypothetical protein TECD_00255 [Hyphomicrobiaceae bacterium hypho_1]
MPHLVSYFLAIAIASACLSWLADNPGSIMVNWQGYIWDTNIFQVTILLSFLTITVIILWNIFRNIWQAPAAISSLINQRREKRGFEALSSGLIAVGAGDRTLAIQCATQARASLPYEPMTHLLRAQAAQLAGDRAMSRRIFETMLATPNTEAFGLRGLFLEAEYEGELEVARQLAERAVKLNPKLSWSVNALFDIQCRNSQWDAALTTLAIAKKHGHFGKKTTDRRRAVLLAGKAQACEDDEDLERALVLSLEAHNLAPDLVAAAAVAGRLLSAKGNTIKATKVLRKTWKRFPHPELAVAYAYTQLGDSPKDRLKRVQELASITPDSVEGPIAIANAAIEARDFDTARTVLTPLIEKHLTRRVCKLMARIEEEDTSNTGGVREWLSRAVNSSHDPVWTADGIISDTWLPVSPVTGTVDSFQWRVPVELASSNSSQMGVQKIDELGDINGKLKAVVDNVIENNVEDCTISQDEKAEFFETINELGTSKINKSKKVPSNALTIIHEKPEKFVQTVEKQDSQVTNNNTAEN